VPEPRLDEKVVAVDAALRSHRIAHAFGGALALAYYAEPRATVDIDVNVFVPAERLARILDALEPLGVRDSPEAVAVQRDGQCRLSWGRTPLDLFFAYHPMHDAMRRAARRVPFGPDTIPILAPEHLVACKALFDRRKDWLDIEQMVISVADLRVDEALDWVRSLAGESDTRYRRLARLADRTAR
jgi:hypothetical protein